MTTPQREERTDTTTPESRTQTLARRLSRMGSSGHIKVGWPQCPVAAPPEERRTTDKETR